GESSLSGSTGAGTFPSGAGAAALFLASFCCGALPLQAALARHAANGIIAESRIPNSKAEPHGLRFVRFASLTCKNRESFMADDNDVERTTVVETNGGGGGGGVLAVVLLIIVVLVLLFLF